MISSAPSLQRQRELLQMEYDYEKKEFLRATELMSIGRKVKRGDAWYPLTVGRSYYNSLNKLVVEITRSTDVDIEHNFEYGRTVCFFEEEGTGQLHYLDFTATVSYAEADRMVVTLPGEKALAALQALERPGVQLHFDETTYRLMFEALDRAIPAKKGRLAEWRDLFHGTLRPRFSAAVPAPSLPWLNASQAAAVGDILRARDVMIVHGPPGTGKTTTLIEGVCEVLRREPQVLVCAQSNTAVDWISEQLADRGVSVLRVGNPTRVTDKMLANTYERRFEAHPDYPTLWQIRRTIRQLYSTSRRGRGHDFHRKVARLRERADELELRIRQSLFDNTRVVAATLAGSAQAVLSGQHFHTLFIDEAAQALEAACWIALDKADRVILAGDHCQLPPTIKSPAAMRGGLGCTLMEHLAQTKPEAVRLLTIQYRMNEEIMRFSSQRFYGGKLQAAPEVRHRSMLDDLDTALVWLDTDSVPTEPDCATPAPDGAEEATPLSSSSVSLPLSSALATAAASGAAVPPVSRPVLSDMRETFVAASYGRVNKGEAQLTMRALRHYVARIGRQRLLEERADFGVISPYKAQVQYLRALVRRDRFLRPLADAITVNTVDAFQGQERDVILVSLVRANEEGQIGFLSDLRRMNVAMTRARMKLIIIGSSGTLCHHAFYRDLYAHCHHEAPPADVDELS